MTIKGQVDIHPLVIYKKLQEQQRFTTKTILQVDIHLLVTFGNAVVVMLLQCSIKKCALSFFIASISVILSTIEP